MGRSGVDEWVEGSGGAVEMRVHQEGKGELWFGRAGGEPITVKESKSRGDLGGDDILKNKH